MKQKRYKTSIAFNEENWIKLQNIAAIQNTSPTAILNDLLDAYVNEKLPDRYEEQIKEKVFLALNEKIDDYLVEGIAQKVVELIGSGKVQTVDLHLTDATNATNATFNATNATSATKDATNTTNATKDIDVTNATSATKDTVPEDDKRKSNIAKFKRYKASDNKKSYNDSYVAAQENRSKTAVNRYRTGRRSPQQDFIDRWGLSWNGEQWIKNEEEV